MNKRLLLSLYDRSGLGAYMPVDYKGHEMAVEEHWEKFAELIVKECVGVIESGRFLHDQAPTAIFAKECSGAVKRHFGVEE